MLNTNAELTQSISHLEVKKPLCVIFGRPNKNWSFSNNDLSNLPLFDETIKKQVQSKFNRNIK